MTVSALRALPVPDTEPPLEDVGAESGGWQPPGRPLRAVQGVLALVVGDAGGGTALDGRGAADDDEADFGPRPTATRELPPAAEWGRRLVQVVVEVMCGQRPPAQLVRWTSQEVYAEVLSQTLPAPRPGAPMTRRRPRVSSVRVCEPVDGVAELSAVVHGQYRVQALAVRLEGRDGRWQATALATG